MVTILITYDNVLVTDELAQHLIERFVFHNNARRLVDVP